MNFLVVSLQFLYFNYANISRIVLMQKSDKNDLLLMNEFFKACNEVHLSGAHILTQ